MTFTPCPKHDLTGSVHPGAPEAFARRNILYVPRTAPDDINFGLYDENSRQLTANILCEGWPPHSKSQRILPDLATTPYRPTIPRAIYGGVLSRHYGHFITECLNTLWYYCLYGKPEDLVVFHAPDDLETLLAIPWLADFLRYAGLRREQILIPDTPTVIEHLAVPSQAFSEDAFAYQAFSDICQQIGDRALAEAPPIPDQPVYLTRARLINGTQRFDNETELTDALAQRGVRIVAPETLSVAEQIASFTHAPVIGMIGSGFHTSIFSRDPCGLILSPTPVTRRSYPLMDATHNARFSYLHPENTQTAPVPGFTYQYHLHNPEALAESLLRHLDTLPDTTTTHPRPWRPRIDPSRIGLALLHTPEGEQVMLAPAREQVHARTEPHRKDAPLLLITLEDDAFLCALHPDAPVIALMHETLRGPVLSYRLIRHENTISLQHPQNHRFVSAPPAHVNHPAHCNAEKIDLWEHFTLNPLRDITADKRLATMLDAILKAASYNGQGPDPASLFPPLGPALARLAPPA